MMKRCGIFFILGLSACGMDVDQTGAVQFCDHQAQFVDRLTGEKIYIDLDPLTERFDRGDLAMALEWCDLEILCTPFDDWNLEGIEVGEAGGQLPATQREIFVDHQTRVVSGFATYRIYQPAGPGWDLLSSVVIHDEWYGGSDEWTFVEASMPPVEGGGYIDFGAYFDAEGCQLRVPRDVELPSPDAPLPVRYSPPSR